MTFPHKPEISARHGWLQKNTRRARKRKSSKTNTAVTSTSSAISKQRRDASRNLPLNTQKKALGASPTLLTSPTKSGVSRVTVAEASKAKISATPVRYASESAPLWLLRLQAFHRNSSIITFLLVVAMLVAYGWTVYSQQVWSQTYRKMQDLQRQERQLTTTNSVLKNKMAQEGEKPSAGLVSPTPEGTIFLPPTNSFNPNQQQPSINPNYRPQQSSSPLGY